MSFNASPSISSILIGVIVHLALVAGSAAASAPKALRTVVFSNGFRLSLLPSAGTGMAASVVIVPCGVRDESASLSGAAHMMEHMMFNGTTRRNQKELYEAIDSLGAYVNAATREDHTCFLALLPSERFGDGIDLQAEMLLQSTLPAEKLEKERGVVLQELAKDRGRPDFFDEARHRRHLFAGTPYARETLGNPVTIAAMPRRALADYHRRLYRPARMRAYVFGQFDEEAVLRRFRALYGGDPALRQHEGAKSLGKVDPAGRTRTLTAKAAGPSSRLFLSMPLPLPPARDWAAARVLAARLGQGRDNPLQAWARGHGATGVSASTRFNRDFAFFDVTASLPAGADLDEVLSSLRVFLLEEGSRPVDVDWLRRHARRVAADDLFLSENMHYYAFMRASMLANASVEAMDAERLAMAALAPQDLVDVADRIFRGPSVATLLKADPKPVAATRNAGKSMGGMPGGAPKSMGGMPGGAPKSMGGMPGGTMKAMGGRPESDSTTPPKVDAPRAVVPTRRGSPAGSGGELVEERLPSGMRCVFVSAEGPPILAVHLLARGRSDGESRPGALALAHRCMARRARDLPPAELQVRLDELGARLKFHDDEGIPFDDYYSRPDFAYLRFEAMDETAPEALALFARLAFTPDFRAEDLGEIRRGLSHGGGGRSPSASDRAREALAEALYGKGCMTGAVLPRGAALDAVTVEDLGRSHDGVYRGDRLILVVVSSRPVAEIRRLVREKVEGRVPRGGGDWPSPRFAETLSGRSIEERVAPGERGLVAMARLFDCPPGDRAALLVLGSILSERLTFEIRERRGLAYGVGAGADMLWGQASLSLRFATRPDAVPEALEATRRVVAEIARAPLEETDCRRAAEKLLGRRRMRLLPRINRAFRTGWNLHHGHGPRAHEELDRALMDIGVAEVKAMAERVLRGPWVEAMAR